MKNPTDKVTVESYLCFDGGQFRGRDRWRGTNGTTRRFLDVRFQRLRFEVLLKLLLL